jgi:hypothetical protein
MSYSENDRQAGRQTDRQTEEGCQFFLIKTPLGRRKRGGEHRVREYNNGMGECLFDVNNIVFNV